MRKKGVELSMNVIIIAAIGLLVLVILAVLVINSTGGLNRNMQKSCSLQGGVCRAGGCNNADGETPISAADGTSLCGTAGECCKIFSTNV